MRACRGRGVTVLLTQFFKKKCPRTLLHVREFHQKLFHKKTGSHELYRGHNITNLGGILVKQYKRMGIFRDFPFYSALFGLVSYNALGHVFVSNLDMKHLIMAADACLEAKYILLYQFHGDMRCSSSARRC